MENHSSSGVASMLKNATLPVAFLTGLFYFLGYTYLEGFYGYFNVSIRSLGFDFNIVLLYGLPNMIIPFFIIGVLLIFLGPLSMKFTEKWKYTRCGKRMIYEYKITPKFFWLGTLLLLGSSALIYLALDTYQRGQEAAQKYASERSQSHF